MQGGFEKTRTDLVDRPWGVDNLDEVLARWQETPHHKAMLFVDNAGTDVVLGGSLADELVGMTAFVNTRVLCDCYSRCKSASMCNCTLQ